MKLTLRILWHRLRSSAVPASLRLLGLTLAVLLSAVIPTFVTASMEGVLRQQLVATPDPLTVVVAWSSPDTQTYDVARLDQYLRGRLPGAAGVEQADSALLLSSVQRGVQQYDSAGKLLSGRRWLKLGALPGGLALADGRLPEPGQNEVAVLATVASRSNWPVGTRLRIGAEGSSPALDVTVVGTLVRPEEGPLAHLTGPLEATLLTHPESYTALDLPPGEATWAVALPEASFHTAGVPGLVGELRDLPVRVGQLLDGAEVITTPVLWLTQFQAEMAATERFLLVLLTPVFLLVLFFISAVAESIVSSRRTEIAVLRSRGATPLKVVGYYGPESLAMAAVALLLGLLLTKPVVRLMSLSAGFLQLVGREPIPSAITLQTILYAVVAAMLAEAAALWPLARATKLTVASLRQEAAGRSIVLTVLQYVAEVALLAVLAYGTWRLMAEGPGSDPLFLALPYLALAVAGLAALRLTALLLTWLDRLASRWLSPPFYLALSLLRSQSGRHRGLALMLAITAGLGIYGAAFARTLDRDLVAQAEYRTGADLVIRPLWEMEILSVDANGLPEEIIYREPPYEQFRRLPGAVAEAQVQLRPGVNLAAGTKNLGRADLLGITPQAFGQVANFWPELTAQHPVRHLNLLAAEERGALLSRELANRTGLKVGDQIRIRQEEAEVALLVAGIVEYWPGRLPADGEFLVANLHVLQDGLALAPYEIWVRLEPGASVVTLFEAIRERGQRLMSLLDTRSEVARGRREPFRLGTYATLSAGFAVAVLVMALTYLLTVGFTLQSRAKELGVLRAMGMGARKVALSLYLEQLVTVGTAAGAGLLAGGAVAKWYVPILRQQAEPLLPLKVADVAGDRLWLLIALALALAAGGATVAVWLKRLNLNTALRLGEDG